MLHLTITLIDWIESSESLEKSFRRLIKKKKVIASLRNAFSTNITLNL